ncbi:unnamed protein product [Adineta ricciae]|uniref:Uncharacterized protein n=1 Tax=Adineta ricciae TaxID=249248 RepID=A0A813UDT4_ADIRI|nr:unnamed protein product [Adineta ricciae]
MAEASTTHKTTDKQASNENRLALVWLDDNALQDPEAKEIFLSLFKKVFCFNQPLECLELVESADGEPACISMLVSGKYGQMYVPNRLQPLNQIKSIYVYCMDTVRHNQWAQLCDKVRCVESDFGKIFECMQKDLTPPEKPAHHQPQHEHSTIEVELPQEQQAEAPQEEFVSKPTERFTTDANLHDQLALQLLLKKPANDDDGVDDFKKYCQNRATTASGEEVHDHFQVDTPLENWYKPDLCYVDLNATDLFQLWALRWFIRIFYEQLTVKCNQFNASSSTRIVYYGTWVRTGELDKIKQRIGEFIICNELLLAYTNKHDAIKSLDVKINDQVKHRIIFEINIDKHTQFTVPYGELDKDRVLLWCGSRHRIIKVELIDENDSCWLVGLSLSPTLNRNQATQDLYEDYSKSLRNLDDTHHAFGRILIYKGLYSQAEKWFENTTHYEELAEVTLRQNLCQKASDYLQQLPEDSHSANLLRAYVYLLTSSDNIGKGKLLLTKIYSDANDDIVGARAAIALGFIEFIVTQKTEEALKYFTSAYDILHRNAPEIHPDVAKSLIAIGYVHFAKDNLSEAEKIFREALAIQSQFLPYNHPDIGKGRIGLAHCLAANPKKGKEALQELGSAIRALIRAYRRTFKIHPEVLLTRSEIERVQNDKQLHARNLLFDYI